MTESSELKEVAEADLLDASCAYINWEQTRSPIMEFHVETRENGSINPAKFRVILLFMVSRRLLQALEL